MNTGLASISVRRSWIHSGALRRKSRIASIPPAGRSCATPPGRMNAWFIRSPVISSNRSRTFSRIRTPCRKIVVAPSSSPNGPIPPRCEAIRFSSSSSTRISLARSGSLSSMPSSRSTDRQYAVSLKIGVR